MKRVLILYLHFQALTSLPRLELELLKYSTSISWETSQSTGWKSQFFYKTGPIFTTSLKSLRIIGIEGEIKLFGFNYLSCLSFSFSLANESLTQGHNWIRIGFKNKLSTRDFLIFRDIVAEVGKAKEFAFFGNLSLNAHRFEIRSVNAEGESPEKAVIFLPSSRERKCNAEPGRVTTEVGPFHFSLIIIFLCRNF